MKLPRFSGREVVRILAKAGFLSARQKGSQVILQKVMSGGKNYRYPAE
jgi:predicted RNA binding protein YcfA (HicA-like mRNA interferase family)